MSGFQLTATEEIARDGVHENVTVTETGHEGTKVIKGCTITTTTDEWGGKHFEVIKPDIPRSVTPSRPHGLLQGR